MIIVWDTLGEVRNLWRDFANTSSAHFFFINKQVLCEKDLKNLILKVWSHFHNVYVKSNW